MSEPREAEGDLPRRRARSIGVSEQPPPKTHTALGRDAARAQRRGFLELAFEEHFLLTTQGEEVLKAAIKQQDVNSYWGLGFPRPLLNPAGPLSRSKAEAKLQEICLLHCGCGCGSLRRFNSKEHTSQHLGPSESICIAPNQALDSSI